MLTVSVAAEMPEVTKRMKAFWVKGPSSAMFLFALPVVPVIWSIWTIAASVPSREKKTVTVSPASRPFSSTE
ncbi:hypothetical protein D3C72_809830 [compost metagenome]